MEISVIQAFISIYAIGMAMTYLLVVVVEWRSGEPVFEEVKWYLALIWPRFIVGLWLAVIDDWLGRK